jgi:hypothetical protein
VIDLNKYRYVITPTGNRTHMARLHEVALCNLYEVYPINTKEPWLPICKECQRKMERVEVKEAL